MGKYFLILTIVSLVFLWPFFRKGFFKSHDGEWMVIRFSAFHQTLTSGQIPVRFVERLNNNYGYPVFNFLYPLPFYLAEIPKLIGFNFQNSIKIVFITTTLSSTILMFWALSQKFGNLASLTGSIVFLLVPYRFVDLYVRGSLGENVAFSFLPLILGSILKVAKGDKRFLPIIAISTCLLLLSHNVIAVLFLPIFVSICFIENKRYFLKSLAFLALGIALASFFAVPALYDLQYVMLSKIKVSDSVSHLSPLPKILSPLWGFGPNPNSANGFSTQLGMISLVIFIGALAKIVQTKKAEKLAVFCLCIFLAASFLITNYSNFIWKTIPFIDVIQFPWRMLSIIVFSSAILGAYLIDQSEKIKKTLSFLIIFSAMILSLPYTRPVEFTSYPDSYYSTNEDTTTVKDEYLPVWVKQKPNERAKERIQKNEQISIIEKTEKPTKIRAIVHAKTDTTLIVNYIYFPGFITKVDGKRINADYLNNNGLIALKLPKGIHEVIINFNRSPAHLLSELVSLLALALTLFLLFKSWQKQKS